MLWARGEEAQTYGQSHMQWITRMSVPTVLYVGGIEVPFLFHLC